MHRCGTAGPDSFADRRMALGAGAAAWGLSDSAVQGGRVEGMQEGPGTCAGAHPIAR